MIFSGYWSGLSTLYEEQSMRCTSTGASLCRIILKTLDLSYIKSLEKGFITKWHVDVDCRCLRSKTCNPSQEDWLLIERLQFQVHRWAVSQVLIYWIFKHFCHVTLFSRISNSITIRRSSIKSSTNSYRYLHRYVVVVSKVVLIATVICTDM